MKSYQKFAQWFGSTVGQKLIGMDFFLDFFAKMLIIGGGVKCYNFGDTLNQRGFVYRFDLKCERPFLKPVDTSTYAIYH